MTTSLLAHGRGTALAELGLLGLALGNTLGKDLGVFVGLVLDLLGLAALEGNAVALVLETLGGNESLDLGSLGVRLLALALGLDLAANDVLADIVILGEAEELADLGGALGAEALGVDDVGEAGDVGLALLDDGEGEDGEVHADDAATDGLALALTGAAGAVAGVSLGEKEADTGRVHNTLLHRETLLVVASGDAEDVALELVADGVTGDLSAHALLHEDAELALILNVDELLAAIGRVGDVQLHLAGVGWCKCCRLRLGVGRGLFNGKEEKRKVALEFSRMCASLEPCCEKNPWANHRPLEVLSVSFSMGRA